jgi:hypothetical protein
VRCQKRNIEKRYRMSSLFILRFSERGEDKQFLQNSYTKTFGDTQQYTIHADESGVFVGIKEATTRHSIVHSSDIESCEFFEDADGTAFIRLEKSDCIEFHDDPNVHSNPHYSLYLLTSNEAWNFLAFHRHEE